MADGDTPDWRALFTELDALDADADAAARQRRGHAFERALWGMFDSAEMEPRSRFRPSGEEIDGSFLHHARPMLFEAKWTKVPVPASLLYAFRGKLDGKLAGTLGIFVSMGGYSKDAVDALIAGKSLNLILFDGDDMRNLARADGIGIEAAIDFKLRAAAEEGTPFMPLLGPSPGRPHACGAPTEQLVIVEGPSDVAVMRALLEVRNVRSRTTLTPAGGRLNQPLVALAQLALARDAKRLIIVADGDRQPDEVRRQIERTLAEADAPADVEYAIIVIDPNLEIALGLPDRRLPITLEAVIKGIDLDARARSNPELGRLLRLLGILNGNDA